MDQVRCRDMIVRMREMLLDLRYMARAEGVVPLAYFIEMAVIEADDILRCNRPVRGELFLEPVPPMPPDE